MIDSVRVRSDLEVRLRRLQERAEDIEADLSVKPDSDWDENAIDSADDEVLAEMGDKTLHDLQDVRIALNRLAMGNYGICASCGGDIGEERLEALPTATRCIRCA